MTGMAGPTDAHTRSLAGRYRLSEALGSGAMGTVWAGFDEVLQRAVAVKELKVPRGVPQGEAAALRERMLREARALGGLSHPNVIMVFDVVDVDGNPFVVLELLPSRNLSAVITEVGRLNQEQAAAVGVSAAAALLAAHRSGITHRDVKPGNVLVADDGRIKLTDFGIARNTADAPMTTTGLVLGSPAYIAPEVAAGRPVTPAADLWGLGATLYAAVEGQPPYNVEGDAVKTVSAVVDGEVPRPSQQGPVCDVIAALMVKDPAGRMPLDEARRRLRPLLADPDDPLFRAGDAPSPPARRLSLRNMIAPAGSVSQHTTPPSAAPLAAHPGPLPSAAGAVSMQTPAPPRSGTPAPQAPRPPQARRPSVVASAGLVIAGAVVVLVGAAGGWAVTRALAGESPWSTSVSSVTADVALVAHTDALGFVAQVPTDWVEYRQQDANDAVSVRFVSPDGRQQLQMDKIAGQAGQPAGTEAFTNGLTPALGVEVSIDERPKAVPGATGTNPPQELRYRTSDGTASRVTLVRLVPRGNDLFVLRLSVPADAETGAVETLFERIAAGFKPA